jgi:hypothetical protein
LPRQFYDRRGEQVAHELEEWFSAVDAQYRSELRELNELNFARFDAKVGERFAEFDARIEKRFVELEAKVSGGFAEQNALIARQFASQSRWLYVSLAAQLALMAGLYLR